MQTHNKSTAGWYRKIPDIHDNIIAYEITTIRLCAREYNDICSPYGIFFATGKATKLIPIIRYVFRYITDSIRVE